MSYKIKIDQAASTRGTDYPSPFDEPCRERFRRRLGDAAGLTQFGVNLLVLPPGAWSSQRHWHTIEDEFVYVVDGEVVESDPPRRLVHTYRFLFGADNKAEGFTRVTWEIEPVSAGFSRLSVTHELEGAPIMAGMVASKFSEQGAGGWAWILSDMKTLLETGTTM